MRAAERVIRKAGLRRSRRSLLSPQAALKLKLLELVQGEGRAALLARVAEDPGLRRRLGLDATTPSPALSRGLDQAFADPALGRLFGQDLLGDEEVRSRIEALLPEDALRQRALIEAWRGKEDGPPKTAPASPVLPKKKARGRRSWPSQIVKGLGIVAMPVVVWLLWLFVSLPSGTQIQAIVERPSLQVTLRDDGTLAFAHPVFPIPVWMSTLPDHVTAVVVEGEDRGFYEHWGFSLSGIGRAVRDNVLRLVNGQGLRGGGSTITQQLARLVFLNADRSPMRKLKEILLAIKLELVLGKEEILRLYLSRAPLGNGVYGFEQAARYYFGERAKDLRPYQAAMLAAMLPSPERRNPVDDFATASRLAHARLMLLVARGRLSAREADEALRAFAGARRAEDLKTGDRRVPEAVHSWFRDWIGDELMGLGLTPGEPARAILTLDPLAQVYGQLALARALREGQERDVGSGALLAMAPSGAVRAMVGGPDWSQSQLNRTTQTRRPPASTFKPFVYLAAIEAGLTGDDPVEDAPVEVVGGRPWPRNFQDGYAGPTTLAEALRHSRNAATVRLGQRIGLERVAEVAKRLGLEPPSRLRPGYLLGTHEVTMLGLVQAYAVIASGGRRPRPHGVLALQGTDGHVRHWRGSEPGERLVARADAGALTGLLREVVQSGTGSKAAFARNVAGKTGTSQDSRDAWFVGYTGDLVAAIWLGNDDNRPMRDVQGGGLPARWWSNFMTNVYDDRTVPSLPDSASPTPRTPR